MEVCVKRGGASCKPLKTKQIEAKENCERLFEFSRNRRVQERKRPIRSSLQNRRREPGGRARTRASALLMNQHAALPLALALSLMTDLFFRRATCHTGGPFGLRRYLPARRALQLLAFCLVGNCLRIHQLLFSPAYFSISFLRP